MGSSDRVSNPISELFPIDEHAQPLERGLEANVPIARSAIGHAGLATSPSNT